MLISIVSPVYLAEKIIDKLVAEIIENVTPITTDFEIILVEDGSPDNSWEKISQNAARNKQVKAIKLSRNFGQHYAITAGLEHAKGEWVIVMDCDLQDRPDQIHKLFMEAQKGYDLVLAKRTIREDSFMKRFSSRVFYKVFGYLTDTVQDKEIANFGIYNKKVIRAILNMRDQIRYFPTMSQWVGFKKQTLIVKHGEREEGNSSYSWKKLFALAFDNIISFSDKPLRITISIGLFISLISAALGILTLIRHFRGEIVVDGYTSIILSIWFLSGLIIFILGILGIYISKMFEKTKGRPLYIIDERKNFSDD